MSTAQTWSSVVFHATTHDWYDRQHFYQAFARNLSRRCPVLYVSSPIPWRRSGRGTPVDGGYLSEHSGIHVFAPTIPSGARFREGVPWWRHFQDAIAARAVLAVMRRIGFEPHETLLLSMKPDALPLTWKARWAATALWVADDWEIPDILQMMQRVDVVLAASPPTMEFARTSGARGLAALGAGVDYEAFLGRPRAVPTALSTLRRPLVGYAGGISARLDFPLLRQVAQELRGTLVMVGPVLDEAGRAGLDTLLELPNVVWLGHKEEDEAQECVASFDVGLIPYVRMRHTLGSNPAKLYEYLASGVPVVATDLPLLRYFSDVISVASDEVSFVSSVRVAIDAGKRGNEVLRRRRVAAAHSYLAIVDLLFEQVSRVRSGLDPIPPERAWRIPSE